MLNAVSTDIKAGFKEPSLDAIDCFRVIMEATSRPAMLQSLESRSETPGQLNSVSAQILLTLVDADTPVWIDPALLSPDVESWVEFHCGTRIVGQPSEAAFALVTPETSINSLEALPLGDAETPDRSATIILQTTGVTNLSGPVCSGPGIKEPVSLNFDGAYEDLWWFISRTRSDFPVGLDWYIAAPNELAALPRSTKLEFSSCM